MPQMIAFYINLKRNIDVLEVLVVASRSLG